MPERQLLFIHQKISKDQSMNRDKKIYKSIGEVSKEISISTHTLRFWEKEFKQIKPITFDGNRRYYTEKDIDILKIIYELLKKQGYTIMGAKKLLNRRSCLLYTSPSPRDRG